MLSDQMILASIASTIIISCLDNININLNDFCLEFINYGLQFEPASSTNNINTPATFNTINGNNNCEYLDCIGSVIDTQYSIFTTTIPINIKT